MPQVCHLAGWPLLTGLLLAGFFMTHVPLGLSLCVCGFSNNTRPLGLKPLKGVLVPHSCQEGDIKDTAHG